MDENYSTGCPGSAACQPQMQGLLSFHNLGSHLHAQRDTHPVGFVSLENLNSTICACRCVVVAVVQSLSHAQLFATPWAAKHQASLSFTISWSLLKLMSIESTLPSNHLILCHPLLLLPSIFLSIMSFPMSWLFTSGGQSIGTPASVLPVDIQD